MGVKVEKTKGSRRDCREWAVQLLFQMDMNAPERLDPVFAAFWKEHGGDELARGFTERIVRGVWQHRTEIDACIRGIAENWDLKRMRIVDRNVLRMALFEMQYENEVPPVVLINEAVDLAKYFGTRESGSFVNGILDKARKELKKPAGGAGKKKPKAGGVAKA